MTAQSNSAQSSAGGVTVSMADRPSDTGREDTVALPLPPKRPAPGTNGTSGSQGSGGQRFERFERQRPGAATDARRDEQRGPVEAAAGPAHPDDQQEDRTATGQAEARRPSGPGARRPSQLGRLTRRRPAAGRRRPRRPGPLRPRRPRRVPRSRARPPRPRRPRVRPRRPALLRHRRRSSRRCPPPSRSRRSSRPRSLGRPSRPATRSAPRRSRPPPGRAVGRGSG